MHGETGGCYLLKTCTHNISFRMIILVFLMVKFNLADGRNGQIQNKWKFWRVKYVSLLKLRLLTGNYEKFHNKNN